MCRIGGAAFLSPRAAAGATKDGVAICTLREEELSLATHLVARAENGSKVVSEFARSFVKRLKQPVSTSPFLRNLRAMPTVLPDAGEQTIFSFHPSD